MVSFYNRENRQLLRLKEPEAGCWVNISPPFTHDELEAAAEQFSIPLDFLTDSLDIDERPRFEREDDVRLVLLSTPILNEGTEREDEAIYTTVPIGIITTIEHVITISAFESPVIEQFLDNKVKNFDPTDERQFVLQIMETNVNRYLSCLKKLNIRRNLIEKELENSSQNSELKQLLSVEKSLVYFVNGLSLNELLMMKIKRIDLLGINKIEDLTDLFEDVIVDNAQALSMANIYTNILNGTMDAYSSIISNNLNQFINRLTVITVALAVPTLIASLLGMNIPNGMENNNWAFPMVLTACVLFTLGLSFYMFRRK
jgi:magnesium transporter